MKEAGDRAALACCFGFVSACTLGGAAAPVPVCAPSPPPRAEARRPWARFSPKPTGTT